MRTLQHWLGAKALLGLARYARRLPEDQVARVGDRIGLAIRRLSARHRRLVLANLQIALGREKTPAELEEIALTAYRYAGRSLVEFMRMADLTKEQLLARCALEGTEHFHAALAKGKGVVLLTGHYGNWELVGARLAAEGLPMNVIARSQADPKVTDLLMDMRTESGMRVIDRDRGAAGAIKALRRNEIVAILLDQNASSFGIFVDFFGKLAATATGPAAIARRTGAAVVPVFAVRRPDNSHVGVIMPELELEWTEDKDADIKRNTQIMVKLIEEQIRLRPEQWFWMHQRWKTRPPEEKDSPVYAPEHLR